MTREEAIKVLRETYCGNKVFCELFKVDLCLTTDCEIYHAIKALEVKPIERKESDVYCDRNLCAQNEYNGIECDECQEKRKNEVEE